jgi:hypothetical protein
MAHPIRQWLAIMLVTAGTVAAAADAPYIGKWKFNPAKSQLAGGTYSIENAPGGMMRFDLQGFAYNFKMDGKEYSAPDGSVNTWKATTPTTWDVVSRLNGKVVANYSMTVSGDTVVLKISQIKPEGGSVDSSSNYKRVSGGPGMLGKWQSTEVKMPALNVELSANGADGLMWKDDTGFMIMGKFDGKDYPASGSMAGSKIMLSFKKIGDRSFEMTTKIDGKPFYTDTFSVSADGKTLTDNGAAVNAKQETIKAVYDKQ